MGAVFRPRFSTEFLGVLLPPEGTRGSSEGPKGPPGGRDLRSLRSRCKPCPVQFSSVVHCLGIHLVPKLGGEMAAVCRPHFSTEFLGLLLPPESPRGSEEGPWGPPGARSGSHFGTVWASIWSPNSVEKWVLFSDPVSPPNF